MTPKEPDNSNRFTALEKKMPVEIYAYKKYSELGLDVNYSPYEDWLKENGY